MGSLESDGAAVEQVASGPAFQRRFKKAKSKHDPKRYLPDDPEYGIMRVCVAAAGETARGAEWYETRPLSEVYKWLAIKLAEVEE